MAADGPLREAPGTERGSVKRESPTEASHEEDAQVPEAETELRTEEEAAPCWDREESSLSCIKAPGESFRQGQAVRAR